MRRYPKALEIIQSGIGPGVEGVEKQGLHHRGPELAGRQGYPVNHDETDVLRVGPGIAIR
jgi:hypothetical protein